MTYEFEAFPKIQRYQKAIVTITEKIDGTNACIAFTEDGEVTIQSRKRLITPVLAITQLSELNETLNRVMDTLAQEGSQTREGKGWTAEGCMIFSHAFGYLKAPFEPNPKGASAQAPQASAA